MQLTDSTPDSELIAAANSCDPDGNAGAAFDALARRHGFSVALRMCYAKPQAPAPEPTTGASAVHRLKDSIADATAVGAEVVIPVMTLTRLMLAAGHPGDFTWDDAAIVLSAVITYDPSIPAVRLTAAQS